MFFMEKLLDILVSLLVVMTRRQYEWQFPTPRMEEFTVTENLPIRPSAFNIKIE